MDQFFTLTPDAVIQAIEESGHAPTGHCLQLNSFENRVYDLKLESGEHVIAKFYRPGRWSREQIEEEHEFLFELQSDEIPVCAPLRFPDGRSLHDTGGIHYAIWPRTGGRAADEFTDETIEMLGRLVARLHNRGAVAPARHRLTLTGESYGLAPLDFLVKQNFLPDGCRDRYIDAVETIARIYDTMSDGVPLHRIHGDCHTGNLLVGSSGFFFLDFDDFLTGPAVQDLWMLVPARDDYGRYQRELFLDAYAQFRPFDRSWLRLIEPLRALRYVHYAAWIARRWNDPMFPQAFPHFGTVSYWDEETRNLEEQIDLIREEGGAGTSILPPAEEKEELTNKDFFWDLDE